MLLQRHMAVVAAGLASALCVSASGVAMAADTQAAWEGYATNTAATSQCSGVGGTGVGDTHVSIFRPKINSTDTNTFLSMMHLRAAITFQNTSKSTVHQMHGSGNYTATGINSRGKAFTYSSTYSGFTVTPNPIVGSTSVINITTGKLNNYFNTSGCTVTFKAVYVKRID